MSNLEKSRRDFFKNVALAIVGGFVFDILIGRSAKAQSKPELIDLSEKKRKDATNKSCVQAAKGINYRDSAAELAKDIKSGKVKATPPEIKDKTGKNVPTEARTCSKCALFGVPNPQVPNCVLIPGCLVQAGGSCTSWTPKPGAI